MPTNQCCYNFCILYRDGDQFSTMGSIPKKIKIQLRETALTFMMNLKQTQKHMDNKELNEDLWVAGLSVFIGTDS